MTEIERFISEIVVEEPQEELLEVFKDTPKVRVLEVSYKGEQIFKTKYPSYDTCRFLQALDEASIDGLDYELAEVAVNSHCADFAGICCPTYRVDKGTMIELTTYGDEADEHYNKLENIKSLLYESGFTVKEAACEVVKHVVC